MANGPRYQFGDTLIPTLARGIGNIDSIAAAAMKEETRRQELAKDRQFAREESQIAREESEKNRAFQMQQFEFRKEQAKQAEMNRLVASVSEPYQKAMIYRKYGVNDLAENFTKMGDTQEAQKDIVRQFDSLTDSKDILEGSATTLKALDPTSEFASHVRNSRQKAIEDLDVTYSELMDKTDFRVPYESYKEAQKSITMSEDAKSQATKLYLDALERYGVIEGSKAEAGGAGGVSFTDDDEIGKIVDDIIGERGLNLSTGEEEVSMVEQAEAALDVSEMSLGKINRELSSRKKIIKDLKTAQNFRKLSPREEKELTEQEQMVEGFESRMREEKKRGRGARKVIGKDKARKSYYVPYMPFR